MTVNVASGGSSQGGFSVTFPDTVSNNYSNWSRLSVAYILKADGTVLNIKNQYSVAGKTIDGVVLFAAGESGGFFGLQFTFEGRVCLYRPGLAAINLQNMYKTFNDTTVANASETFIFKSQFFIPNSDLTITSISAYDTDV